MNSVIVSGLRKAGRFLKEKFDQSLLGHGVHWIGKSFDRAVEDSLIVNAVSGPEHSDEAYQESIGCKLKSAWEKVVSCLRGLSKTIDESALVVFFKEVTSNAVYYPVRFYGMIFLPLGVFSTIGAYVTHTSQLTLLLSILVSVFGAVMLLIGSSIYTLVFQSWFLDWGFRLFALPKPEVTEKTVPASYKAGLIIGIISGVMSIVTGLFPVLAVLALICAACFAFYRISWSAIILVIVLPFMPTMVMVAGSLALLGCILIKKINQRDEFSDYHSSMNFFVAIMGLVFVVGAVTSVTVVSSMKIAMVYLAFLAAYYVIVKTIQDQKSLTALVNGFVIASLPVALFGIYQKLTGFDAANTWIDKDMFEEISGRVVSFFGNPNVFGEYLIIAIMLCIAAFAYTDRKRYKAAFLVILVCLAASMVFTYSRGCWVGIIIAVAIFLFLENKKLFWAAVALGIVSIFFLPDSIINRFASIGNMSDSSTSYRVYIWEGTLNMLKDFWISGIGLGTDAFNEVYPMYAYSSISAPHPHNLYLLVLTETGVLGLIALVGVIIAYFRKMFYVIAHAACKQYRILASAMAAGMAGFLVQGMFDNVWYNYRVFLLFWIYIAIGVVVSILNKREGAAKL